MKNLLSFCLLILLSFGLMAGGLHPKEESVTDELCEQSNQPLTTTFVTYRANYPDHLYGKTILVSAPQWLLDGRHGKRPLVGALKMLSGATGISFITQGSSDYEIELTLKNSDGCAGNASNTGAIDGLYVLVECEQELVDNPADWIRSFFMHEIGHCIGLGHPDSSIPAGYIAGAEHVGVGIMSPANCGDTVPIVWNAGEWATLACMFQDSCAYEDE